MLELALKPFPGLTLDLRELARPGPSYTVNTLRQLSAEQPLSHFYLLLGMDAWQAFEHWHQWQAILEYCHLVVMTRPGFDFAPGALAQHWRDRLAPTVNDLRSHTAGKLIFVEVPASSAASSEIRRRLAAGLAADALLPPAVNDYIVQQQLYRGLLVQLFQQSRRR